MSIRTTVTLDDDVHQRVKRESRARGATFRDTLNNLVREGLQSAKARPRRGGIAIRPSAMGWRAGLNHDSIESLLEFGEGEAHR